MTQATYSNQVNRGVAELADAPDFDSGNWRFESSRPCHHYIFKGDAENMKTVFDAVQRLNSLDTKIEMLECMDEADTMLIKDADREEIISLLEEYRVFLYEMKVTK